MKTAWPTAPAMASYLPQKGERALSLGQTGSGKTTANIAILKRIEDSPVVIYDTKHEPKFDLLPNNRIARSIADVEAALEDLSIDYIILRPPPHVTSDPTSLDRILQYHELRWRGVPAYIDELYQFHRNGHAGPGVTGLWTRGRSKGITVIGSSQRPAFLSKFIFSESQLFYVFFLSVEDDRKRVKNFIPGYSDLENPSDHRFYVYRQGPKETPKLMPAVPMDAATKMGYTDQAKGDEAAVHDPDDLDKPAKNAIVWL